MAEANPSTLPTRSLIIDRTVFDRVLLVARRLSSSSDLHEVLELVIDALRDILHAERASVFQYDPDRHELFATEAHGLTRDLRLPADKGLIGEAARTKAIINIPDAYSDPRFNPDVDRATGFKTRCLLTIPLLDFERRLIGVAQVLNKDLAFGPAFDADDEAMAHNLADLAAVALKRALLLEAERAKEKLEADLDIAHRIQQASLPDALPAIEGFDVAGHSIPADQTGGDAFDVVLTGEPVPMHHAVVFMADAAGHGIGPALSVMQVLSMIRMGCRVGASIETIAQNVNDQLHADLPVGRFVTAFLGVLDATAGAMHYLSAGQGPLVLVPGAGSPEREPLILGANAMPFGIDCDLAFDEVPPLRFEPGDVFLLLSDGYYEAADPSGTQFGAPRVIETVREVIDRPAQEILSHLHACVTQHAGPVARADDQTAVIIKRGG